MDDEYTLEDVLVVCPHCGKRAYYRDKTWHGVPLYWSEARFYCDTCYKPLIKPWYGETLGWPQKARCGYCGTPWRPLPKPIREGQRSFDLRCPECGNLETLKLGNVVHYPGKHPRHGLHWWLKTSVGPRELWAFTFTHWKLLRDYIAAPIRANASCSDYFNVVLPKWIKEAKHRDAILKNLDKMAKF